jgi:hypothetical protein
MGIEAIVNAELTRFANRLARTVPIGLKDPATGFGSLAKG